MACVTFRCLVCDHFSHKDFGSLHCPICPKCESNSIEVEWDEDTHEEFYEQNEDCGNDREDGSE